MGLNPGALIGEKYRLTEKLGEGGLGEVWAARHDVVGSEFALKFLKAPDGTDASARFVREARAAAVLTSDHVCKVFDFGTHDTFPFIVMERLRGEDFGHLIDRQGSVSIATAAQVVIQACEALSEAHGQGIFHRDLKPENLFIVWRDSLPYVKVVDFGLATQGNADISSQRLTATTSTFGTPLYMAPEQMRAARRADARSDIWSLGVLLYYATTGRYPFEAESFQELCIKVGTEQAPSLHEIWPDAPQAFVVLVDRCLQHQPANRFQSAADLAQALLPFGDRGDFAPSLPFPTAPRAPGTGSVPLAHAGTISSRTNPVLPDIRLPELPGRPAPLLPKLVGAGMLLAACLGGVAYFVGRPPPVGIDSRSAAPSQTPAVGPVPPSAVSPSPVPSASASVPSNGTVPAPSQNSSGVVRPAGRPNSVPSARPVQPKPDKTERGANGAAIFE